MSEICWWRVPGEASHLSLPALEPQNKRLPIQETEGSERSPFWNSGGGREWLISAMWPYIQGQIRALGKKSLPCEEAKREHNLGGARFF